MNKRYKGLLWGVIGILLLLCGYLWLSNLHPTMSICKGTQCLSVEIARSPHQREQGLMRRTARGSTQGMLFVFDQEDLHDFRMKNTYLPLDMLRIDAQGHIQDIQQAMPCIQQAVCHIYHPHATSLYTLELPQGTTKILRRALGDKLSF